ncbi:ring-1,2-phenylacetyl-CoA epoxidase subunit PaaE [Arcticibacter tournemirensis]|uniref:Iron-sulfur cluster-binding domain-containing protein n=1 Tax=Arcticibacter tournemirensis TaxID=699437 RepID=A0A5M9HLG1_9SPHI|nr:iron-sulfur cluster-binding domain-containing protein [Arcticibacter tournemirensis]KAA8486244.1 iron-sulfur cluster-binding domain-containing protein [Arcticibacter tournemirensis]TQM52045.1 ring-1,2-phenylacetyl-CoA epoxidase subunit PaaE [Arcticibacter tournemirensis]
MALNQEKSLNFRIVSVTQETALAKTYELELLDGDSLNYKPGQFLTFIIRTGQQELRRSYSILSLPGEPLKITVKKVENGAISRFILQHWKEGAIVSALLPAGRFSLKAQNDRQRDIFCFAAGSGIIPILPQIRYLLKNEPQSVIHLVYSNHNEHEALFLEQIEKLAERHPNLHLINLFSDPVTRRKEPGHLSNILLESYVKEQMTFTKEDAMFLVCGPFTYMRMIRITLGFMHFKAENILRENYSPELMRSGNVHHPVFPERNVMISIHNQRHIVKVPSGKDILSASLEGGIVLPYSCRGGVCGNCAAICKRGKVQMSINEVLTDSDLKQGWILTCTGFPEEDNTLIEFS